MSATIGPDKDILENFLTNQFKHMFLMLKRTIETVSFECPQNMFWLRNKKKKVFQLCTLILRSAVLPQPGSNSCLMLVY